MIRREGQGSVKRKDYGFAVNTSLERSDRTRLKCIHMPSLSPTFLYNGDFVPGIREERSSWAWNSRRASGASDTAMASVYHYDLLNRIRTDSTRLRGATAWSAVGSHWQSSYTYDGNGNIQTLYRANATGSQMDNLTYTYTTGTNKLINIDDYQGASTGADIGDQDGNNYAYDATGNMTQDTAAGIEAGGIVWSPYNKIKSITKMGDDTTSKLVYHYDATGNRILKRYYKPYNTLKSTSWYVRDAQGNTLATYTKPSDSSTARQHEVMLYGSTRLAVVETQAPYSDSETDTLGIFDRVSSRTLGTKHYELTDHLGNVRATVTDVVIDHSGDLDAELSTRTDYYPFGMIMGGRNSSADDAHRYGFNGKENDNEVKGEGQAVNYEERTYDPKTLRWSSIDPLSAKYPALSPYQFVAGSPLIFAEIDGRDFSVSEQVSANGKRIVTITFSADVVNLSQRNLDEVDLGAVANRIASSFASVFSQVYSDVEFIAKADIRPALMSENPITGAVTRTLRSNAHGIYLVDNIENNAIGKASLGAKWILLDVDLLDGVSTQVNDGGVIAALERTGPHEIGHSGTLTHPPSSELYDGNIMHQTKNPKAGKKLLREQLEELINAIKTGQVNQGSQLPPSGLASPDPNPNQTQQSPAPQDPNESE